MNKFTALFLVFLLFVNQSFWFTSANIYSPQLPSLSDEQIANLRGEDERLGQYRHEIKDGAFGSRGRRLRGAMNRRLNVFRPDDRIISDNYAQWDTYPFCTVGLLNSKDFSCTASLVTHKHILTNAHCVKDVDVGDFRFLLGYKNHTELAGSDIEAVLFTEKREFNTDAAVLTLKEPLGSYFGWLGLNFTNFSDSVPEEYSLFAYHSDTMDSHESPAFQKGVKDRGPLSYKVFFSSNANGRLHDGDAEPGSSGSVLTTGWEDKQPYIFGINSAHFPYLGPGDMVPYFSTRYANIYYSSRSFKYTFQHFLPHCREICPRVQRAKNCWTHPRCVCQWERKGRSRCVFNDHN